MPKTNEVAKTHRLGNLEGAEQVQKQGLKLSLNLRYLKLELLGLLPGPMTLFGC